MHAAEKRHQVMLAGGINRDIAHQHQFLVVFRKRPFQYRGRVFVQASERFFVRAGHTGRGIAQAFAVRVLADGE